MLNVRRFSKFLTSGPVKLKYCHRIFAEETSNNCRLRTTFHVPRNYYSNKCKDGKSSRVCDKKKSDTSIQTHPSFTNPTCSDKPQVRLKECYIIDRNPCKPPPEGYPSKIPSIQDCPTLPDLMSELPGPKCAWEKQNNRKQKGTIKNERKEKK